MGAGSRNLGDQPSEEQRGGDEQGRPEELGYRTPSETRGRFDRHVTCTIQRQIGRSKPEVAGDFVGKWRVAALAMLCVLGCRTSASGPTVDAETRTVSDWVSPPGASTLAPQEETRQGMAIVKTWELSVPLTWSAYQDRLRGSVWGGGFHERQSDGSHEVFSRVAGGDMFILNVDLVSPGPPLRVRIALTAMPD
jgi:hypothetical protein